MMLSRQHQELLKRMLKDRPLDNEEIRRVDGLGEQYIALADVRVDAKEFTHISTLRIDGVEISIYAKNEIQKAAE